MQQVSSTDCAVPASLRYPEHVPMQILSLSLPKVPEKLLEDYKDLAPVGMLSAADWTRCIIQLTNGY